MIQYRARKQAVATAACRSLTVAAPLQSNAKIQYRARKQAVAAAACRSLTVAAPLQSTQSQSNPALRSSPRASCYRQTDAIPPTLSLPISATGPTPQPDPEY